MLEIELKEQGKISRLTNKTFQFDKRLGEGFYSANYFLRSNKIVKENEPNHIVTMQRLHNHRRFACDNHLDDLPSRRLVYHQLLS